ncbi:MAG: DUF4007 family protein [Fimbriimonadaceae bacterium]|nr:DUF4007 family protein [Fimbriimonadaceae bacterium]
MITSTAIDISSKVSFGGHESFPFRLGWIRKGVLAVGDPNAFNAEDAVVRLGVGKNMVRSIRTWCLATQMLEEKPVAGASRVRQLAPSAVAKVIFGESSDPYMEDAATLWLIHWLLVTNLERLSLWRIAFMYSKENEFRKSDLVSLAVTHSGGQKVEESTVSRDADVLVRCYVTIRSSGSEEDFSCPLTDLGLISHGGGERYSFNVGPKRSLPDEVFGFALVQFLRLQEASECSLSDATYLPGSPGQAFKLDEDSVAAHMRGLERLNPRRWIVNVDGPIRRIGFVPPVSDLELLEEYYMLGVS